MALAWMVDCKTCLLRFAILRRKPVEGKSTAALEPHKELGSFECPHCHEVHRYQTDDCIPGEGRV